MRLGTGTTAPTKADTDVTTFLNGSGKAVDANYPMTNDTDPDNTGAGIDIVSWRGDIVHKGKLCDIVPVTFGSGEAHTP